MIQNNKPDNCIRHALQMNFKHGRTNKVLVNEAVVNKAVQPPRLTQAEIDAGRRQPDPVPDPTPREYAKDHHLSIDTSPAVTIFYKKKLYQTT